MPSTYTQNLGIEQPATGEQAGVWGNTVNSNFNFFDTGIDGNLPISLSANAYSLVTQAGAVSQGRNKVIIWTGTLTAQATINIQPNTAQKLYFMVNQTTGGFPILFQAMSASGTVVTLQPGYAMAIYCDGLGANASVQPVLNNPQFNNILCNNLTASGSLTANAPTTFSQPVTFSAAVTMNLSGSSAAYDTYYRGSSGALVELPIGTIGQALVVTATGPGWATITLAVGAVVNNAGANAIFFYGPGTGGYSGLTQDMRFIINPGIGLGIGLLASQGATPSHSLHIGMAMSPEIWLDVVDSVTQTRQLVMANLGTPRWALQTSNESELGGNVGSNLRLASFADTGTFLYYAISFARASGNVTIGEYPDQGARLYVSGTNPGQPVLTVKGAASQAYLQTWQDSTGAVVASIDGSGKLTTVSSAFVEYTLPSGRVDLHGTVIGPNSATPGPWGAIHIGQEPGTPGGLRGAIAMEGASLIVDALPASGGLIRIYYRATTRIFVIQYVNSTGFTYYAYMSLPDSSGATPVWAVSTSAI